MYVALVAGLTGGAILLQPRRKPPPPAPKSVGFPLAPATPFDPAVTPQPTDPRGAGAGTAFSVDPRGVWLTARHVVEGCARVVIVVGHGRGVSATPRIDPATETAILLTNGGAPALPVAPNADLIQGAMAFHPGFPHGRPGEAASRLLRRGTLVLRRHREPVLSWKEIDRRPFQFGNLAGLSGAPALDERGRVVGVTVAESPRRRELFTTTPASLRAALAAAGVRGESLPDSPLSQETYGAASDALRGALKVAQVACLAN